MRTQKFIELITALEEREWEYAIVDGMLSTILGNQEVVVDKYEDEKIQELIDLIEYW